MFRSANNKKKEWCFYILLFVITNIIIWCSIAASSRRGFLAESYKNAHGQIVQAEKFLRKGTFETNGRYPPGLVLLYTGLKYAGINKINPYLIHVILINMSIAVIIAISSFVIKARMLRCIAVTGIILNPYFIWTAIISDDFIFEFFLYGVFLLISTVLILSLRVLYFIPLMIIGCIVPLFRIPAFFTVGLTLIFLIFYHSSIRKQAVICLILFLGFTHGFMKFNEAKTGIFALGTTGPINMWLGNHPSYIYGHPRYDIDVWLSKRIKPKYDYHDYKREALDFIRSDYIGFAYRSIIKTVWHWFNIEKIPNLNTKAWLDETEDKIIISTRANLKYSLVYVLYKIIYVPLFLFALVWTIRNKNYINILFIIPLIAIWPVVVLTFPDTRFKLVGEIMAVFIIVRTLELRFFNKSSRQP